MDIFTRVKEVTEMCAVSGHECMVFDEFTKKFSNMFDEVHTTPTGSFVGIRRCGKLNAIKLLFDAHIDEIGFMVKEICKGGFLKITNIGGLDTKVLSATEVWIFGKEKISGVFTSVPPHLRKDVKSEKIVLDDLYIDTGRSEEYLKENVPIGTVGCFKTTTERLLNNRIVGKSMDDKICICTILDTFDILKNKALNVDLYALFSGGEETGYIGATTAAHRFMPDYAIAIDVTNSYVPESPKRCEDNKVGFGGVVSFSGTTSRPFTKRFVSVLDKANIPYQIIGEPGRTGTNAHVLNISGAGIPTALISVPLKNMHTPAEVACLDDVKNVSLALAALAESFEEGEI